MKTASRIISVIIVLSIAATAKAQFFTPSARRPSRAVRSNLGQDLRYAQPRVVLQAPPVQQPTVPAVRPPVIRPNSVAIPARTREFMRPQQVSPQQVVRSAVIRPATVLPSAVRPSSIHPSVVQRSGVVAQPRYGIVRTTPLQPMRTVAQENIVPRFTSQPNSTQTQTFGQAHVEKQQVATEGVPRFTTMTSTTTKLISAEPTDRRISNEKTPAVVSAGVEEQIQSSTLKSVLIKHTGHQ